MGKKNKKNKALWEVKFLYDDRIFDRIYFCELTNVCDELEEGGFGNYERILSVKLHNL